MNLLKISGFLVLVGVLILYTSGCGEDFFGDDNESSDLDVYLSPQHSLAWSPDGSMLAYIFDNLLVVKVLETDYLRPLTGTGFYDDPTWSPDSLKIAYSSSSYTERSSVWAKDADGTSVARRITANKWADYRPRWSPDGARIAFYSRRSKGMDIFVQNADGTGEDVVIAFDPATDQNAEWSPDSTKLGFESERSENGDFDVWVAIIDRASPPVQITFDAASDKKPLWSPDGTRIAFQSNRSGETGIWVKNADGNGDAIQINTEYPVASMHNWSPDGTQIAFVSEHVIYVKNSDGTGIVTKIAEGLEPRWSSDGIKMALVALVEDQYEVQIIELPKK